MYAGVVMRRMLDLVCYGVAGRQAQQHDHGTGHDPDDGSEEWTSHKKTGQPDTQRNKMTWRPSTHHSPLFNR
jgi:hypothetical protein